MTVTPPEPKFPQPEIKLPTNAFEDGYHVELGDQRFTQHQWEIIQLYAEGYHRAQVHDTEQVSLDKFFGPDEYVGDLSRLVFTALGAVSACWDNLEGAGTFESTRARSIGEQLIDGIREHFKGHKAQRQNAAFHKAFGIATASSPRAIPAEDVPVVIELIREEFIDELIPALGFKVTFTHDGKFDTIERVAEPNVQEIYDAFIDILYVTYGGMNRAGMQAEPGYDEVQASNMSKLGLDGKPIIAGPNDPDGIFEGRVKKGPNYFKPNLRRVLIEQGWRDDSEQIDFGGFEDH
ncbi:MazG-like nucleotide pyrophosphohydrolase [Microbacterium phage Zayuliv]|nr:MazG-like nucleotide pyrophosphohydrolase [Microbacterium phage Zayuliv]